MSRTPYAKVSVQGGFEGGHGSHWDAVLEDPGELPRVVQEAYKRGTVDEGTPVVLPDEGPVIARMRTLPLGDAGLEAQLVEVVVRGREKPGIATVYPRLRVAGTPLPGSAQGVIEWGHGEFEGEVKFEFGQEHAQVVFFATDFPEGRPEYRGGEPTRVAFSAIAYTCGIISPEARFEEVGGERVDVSRTSIVAPLKDSDRAPYYDDDYFLQGPVAECKPFAYPPWGEGAILKLELDGLGRTPVFARKKDFPHGWPRAGDFVAAYSWLQGRIQW